MASGPVDDSVRAFGKARDRYAPGFVVELNRLDLFGLGVLEAMSNGLIVVGPNAGGTGELLSSMQSPFLFESGNAASFLGAKIGDRVKLAVGRRKQQ